MPLVARQRIFARVFPKEDVAFVDASWITATQFLSHDDQVPDQGLRDALIAVQRSKRENALLEWYFELLRKSFVQHVVPEIERKRAVDAAIEDVLAILGQNHNRFHARLAHLPATQSVLEQFADRFHALVNFVLAEDYWNGRIKQVFASHVLKDGKLDLADGFASTCASMSQLGLQNRAEKAFAEVLAQKMDRHIRERYRGVWGTHAMDDLELWVKRELVVFVRAVISRSDGDWEATLQEMAVDSLGALRVEELFDIIVDYPESVPALVDLKVYIRGPLQRAKLVSSFARVCGARLLHPGANTTDIILQYISTIHAFRILDPKGVLLDRVARPIRRYLRERDDTVRCIISGLAGDTESVLSELADELEQSAYLAADEDEEDFDDLEWVPDPVDAPSDYRKTRGDDIVGSLITIFDTKEVFVRELQALLANRLLISNDYETEREVRNVELLKLRFGASELQMCDVMLRDVADSKRTDVAIHTSKAVPTVLRAKILSKLFWPAFREEQLKLPAVVADAISRYEGVFSSLRADRKLTWLPHLGTVDVQLQLQDRVVEMTVSPAQASLIYVFEEQATWSVRDLARKLGQEESVARRGAVFWATQGVLREDSRDRFTLLEVAQEGGSKPVMVVDEAGPASAVQTVEEASAEEMRVYWSFVVGMLTNLGTLPLERIQGMLKMFVPTGYNRSEEQLKEFLTMMVDEEKLEFTSGAYKLK